MFLGCVCFFILCLLFLLSRHPPPSPPVSLLGLGWVQGKGVGTTPFPDGKEIAVNEEGTLVAASSSKVGSVPPSPLSLC